MLERLNMEAAYVTSKGQLVVPARLRRKYGIKPGTKVFFVERGDEILFQPVTREYIRSVCGILESATSVAEELPPLVLPEEVTDDSEPNAA